MHTAATALAGLDHLAEKRSDSAVAGITPGLFPSSFCALILVVHCTSLCILNVQRSKGRTGSL